MKTKILSLIIALMCSFISSAQQIEFMGLPLHSKITDYCRVLKEHRFTATYKNNNWKDGHFWKQRNCDVAIYESDDNYVGLVNVTIPYNNFNDINDYRQTIGDLLNDFWNKYGNSSPEKYDMESNRYDAFFYAHDHGGDQFYIYTWNLTTGTIQVLYNADRQWSILIQYTTRERINRIKEAQRFRGGGASDL